MNKLSSAMMTTLDEDGAEITCTVISSSKADIAVCESPNHVRNAEEIIMRWNTHEELEADNKRLRQALEGLAQAVKKNHKLDYITVYYHNEYMAAWQALGEG